MAERLFCSVASLEEDEPLPGLGHPSTRTLLWRVPKARWQKLRAAVRKSDGATALAIRAAAKEGRRVVFVSRAAPAPPPPALVSLPEGIARDEEDESRVEDLVLAWCKGDGLVGSADTRTAILCCTDGRTDPCCARFGMATYRALAAAADPSVFNLLESSHLGGCRFATTILVLPAGAAEAQRYGRLTPDQVPAFLTAISEGRPYLSSLRGMGGQREALQVAKVGALVWAASQGLEARSVTIESEPTNLEKESTSEATLDLLVDGTRIAAVLAKKRFRLLDGCSSEGAALDEGHDRWTLLRIAAADGSPGGPEQGAIATSPEHRQDH